ncbi:magnesium-transporting ATPase (P-type) [Bacillus mesophilus]|uniref:Group-specific protein n=1 Tax=Bacillus mesophilus TaxID=1808955 RepID=A0A6M0Q7P0_9BACI|nr:group-specific protein [Bacillus mesophilus]MBM7660968.1 magnesium-transporting ATPase (P-type) [Bacillus mesophilus]NEY71490.1 group-specific protein [Bacillus mesophilus]
MLNGFMVSLIVAAIIMIIIISIAIPMDRKYVVRKANRKIDFTKTTIFFRWNVFDTLAISVAVYAVICVQVLNFLISSGHTVENNFVQFFTNQAQAFTLVGFIYLITRISLVLKGIKERWGIDYE